MTQFQETILVKIKQTCEMVQDRWSVNA